MTEKIQWEAIKWPEDMLPAAAQSISRPWHCEHSFLSCLMSSRLGGAASNMVATETHNRDLNHDARCTMATGDDRRAGIGYAL
jgi:hypothetical protein